MKYTHDPSEYIRGLQQLLISDKKKVGFLFGAGTSAAKKNETSITVPTVAQLTKEVIDELIEKESTYKTLFEELKEELKDRYNIETILSNIEQKLQIIGRGTLNDLNKTQFEKLIRDFKEEIRVRINVHKGKTNEDFKNLVQSDFAKWIKQIERKYPVEIFTTNYDYLFELGLEYYDIPYYDGFTGSYKPFFNSDSVECMSFLPNQTKLWKIHGSLGWQVDEENGKIIRTDSNNNDILIYPSILKYKDSKKQPYTSLMDRLLNFLKTDDSILITCGYSFADDHINERLTSALNSNTTAHLIVLYYDKYWDDVEKIYKFELTENSNLYKIASCNTKISVYGFQSAVIGGKLGEWEFKNIPDKEDLIRLDLYFDSNGHDDEKELNIEKKGTEKWNGGEFYLPNFKNLVRFLSSMMSNNEIREVGMNGK